MPLQTSATPHRAMTLPDGSRLTVPADGRLMTPFVIEEQGDWFEAEVRFVRTYLRSGMAAVDVGANYGAYTSAAATAVGPSGKVWAFEPGSVPRAGLTLSVEDNGWRQVVVRGVALSDRVGEARLGIQDNAELNSLAFTEGAGEMVPLSTLDAESSGFDRPIDFLKLDAEGEEVRILSASASFFAAHDPLVLFELKHGDRINDGLLEAFGSLGMGTFRLVPSLNCLVPHGRNQDADGFQLNAFACSARRKAALIDGGWLVEPSKADPPPATAADPAAVVQGWIRDRPWAGALWPGGLPTARTSGSEVYLAGLADLIEAEDPGRPVAERLARLRRAEALLRQALEKRRSIPRGLALARVQADLGLLGASLETLMAVGRIFAERRGFRGYQPDEPLMPASRRHDVLAPDGQPAGIVVQAMLDEPLLERSAFSIYFSWPRIQPLLQQIAANPLTTPPIRQRLDAVRRWLVGPADPPR